MKTIINSSLLLVIFFAIPTTLFAQSLTSIAPNNAIQGESLGVGISGLNTHFDEADTMSIWFSQGSSTIDAFGYYPVNDTFMTAWLDIPSGAIGLHDLNVYNNIDGTMTLYNSFTINSFNPPELIAISTNSAQQSQFLRVLISGQDTHFNFQQGSNTFIWFSQGSPVAIYASKSYAISDILLVADFDIPEDATTGLRDLNVDTVIDGLLTLNDSFTIAPYNPMLTSVTPGGAYRGQKLSVRISGQNISFGQGSGTIAWLSQGNSLIASRFVPKIVEFENNIAMIADFDIPTDANSGMWDVHAFEEVDGQLTLTDGFMIVQPGDWTSDGVVNFLDLAVIANHWLEGASP